MTHAPDDAPAAEGAAGAPDAPPGRTISPIAGRFGSGRTGKIVTLAALAAGCGVFLAATWHHGKAAPHTGPAQPARQVVNFEPATPDIAPTLAHPGANAPVLTSGGGMNGQVPALTPGSAPEASPAAQAQTRAQAVAQHAAEVQAIRGAPILVFSSGASPGADSPLTPMVPAIRTVAEGATELEKLRQGSAIGMAHASRLPDRNFLIVAGATLPCLLQTAMDTATPGYVSCLVPQDVYSDNGAVVLLEKGTKVLGEYRTGLRQGQNRLFVLWTRAVTPAGVAISLASPASDALGRAGFDGDLETFFWKRFGGALLLSIVGDVGTAAAAHNAGAPLTTVPSDAAGIALQNSINIAPVLRKPQGSEVAIFVAQDFDFSGVYGLRAR